jgi:hypothetical protein
MKSLLVLAAVSEALTGLVVLVFPPIVTRLLFDAEIAGAAEQMSRVAGISLIALAVACWPDRDTRRACLAMLTYSLLAMLYLAWVGLNGRAGILLWPAVAAHGGLSVLLVLAWRKERRAPQASTSASPGVGVKN